MIIGLVLILVSLLCFNFEHISRGRSDWTVIVIGLVLAVLECGWRFKFKKNKDGGYNA